MACGDRKQIGGSWVTGELKRGTRKLLRVVDKFALLIVDGFPNVYWFGPPLKPQHLARGTPIDSLLTE